MAIGEGRNAGVAVGRENVSVLLPITRSLLLPIDMGVPDIVTALPTGSVLLPIPTPEPDGKAMMG